MVQEPCGDHRHPPTARRRDMSRPPDQPPRSRPPADSPDRAPARTRPRRRHGPPHGLMILGVIGLARAVRRLRHLGGHGQHLGRDHLVRARRRRQQPAGRPAPRWRRRHRDPACARATGSRAGDVLIRLDPTLLRSNADDPARPAARDRRARRVRLDGRTRRGWTTLDFPADLLAEAARTTPTVAEMVEGQRNLFEARADSPRQREAEQLERRKDQIAAQIDGIARAVRRADPAAGLHPRGARRRSRACWTAGWRRRRAFWRCSARRRACWARSASSPPPSPSCDGRATEIDLEILKLGTPAREERDHRAARPVVPPDRTGRAVPRARRAAWPGSTSPRPSTASSTTCRSSPSAA